MVAALEVIISDDAGALWEALKMSGHEVESALGVLSEPYSTDDKYLKSLADIAKRCELGQATTSPPSWQTSCHTVSSSDTYQVSQNFG